MRYFCFPLLISFLTFPFILSASAEPPEKNQSSNLVDFLLSPTKNGMFVRLPVIDTDPNRGVTYGVMPIWVTVGGNKDIRHIHVPSVTYNRYVGITGGYEYFYFPRPDSNFHFLSSISQEFERQVIAEYSTDSFLQRTINLAGHVEYSRDGSKRFYGIGPASPRSGESNYTLDALNYRFSSGIPLWQDCPFRANFKHEFQADMVRPGAITEPNDLENIYPQLEKEVHPRRRDAYVRGSISYDTRDSPITTSRGSFAEIFLDGAHKDVLGQYGYYRYGLRLKGFLPNYDKDDTEPSFITAARFRLEQLTGNAPFWALPQMGGKYWHRGYGEGRFIDHGMILFGVEQRCRVFARKISGVATSFWVDPFVDVGTVFPRPELMQAEYIRPVAGLALRAIGRPQIVGSADFGYGQEGLKIFLDINYSF